MKDYKPNNNITFRGCDGSTQQTSWAIKKGVLKQDSLHKQFHPDLFPEGGIFSVMNKDIDKAIELDKSKIEYGKLREIKNG